MPASEISPIPPLRITLHNHRQSRHFPRLGLIIDAKSWIDTMEYYEEAFALFLFSKSRSNRSMLPIPAVGIGSSPLE